GVVAEMGGQSVRLMVVLEPEDQVTVQASGAIETVRAGTTQTRPASSDWSQLTPPTVKPLASSTSEGAEAHQRAARHWSTHPTWTASGTAPGTGPQLFLFVRRLIGPDSPDRSRRASRSSAFCAGLELLDGDGYPVISLEGEVVRSDPDEGWMAFS